MRRSLKKNWSRGGKRSQPGLGRNDVQIEGVFREGHVGDSERDGGACLEGGGAEQWLVGEGLGYLKRKRAFGDEVEGNGERGVQRACSAQACLFGAQRKSRLPAKPQMGAATIFQSGGSRGQRQRPPPCLSLDLLAHFAPARRPRPRPRHISPLRPLLASLLRLPPALYRPRASQSSARKCCQCATASV